MKSVIWRFYGFQFFFTLLWWLHVVGTVPWLGLLATAACVLVASAVARALARAPRLVPTTAGAEAA